MYKVYNSDRKESFLIDYLNARIVSESMVRSIFKYTEKFEIDLKKDVATFNKDEIIKMLKMKKSRSLTSLNNFVIILKHYTNYIIGTGKEENISNAYTLINKGILRKCINIDAQNSAILTLNELRDIQSQMLNATDKAILECIFIGISGTNLEDLTGLCIDQVDSKNMCIHFSSNRTFQIDDYLYKLLMDAFNETEMVSYGENMILTKVNGYGRLYKEKPNAYKPSNPDRRYRWVLRRIVIWREYFGIPVLTAKTISTSGLVYEIKQGLKNTNLPLREFLKTSQGKEIARKRGFKAKDYVDVLFESVIAYI